MGTPTLAKWEKNGLMGTFATLKLIFSDVFVKTEQFLVDFRLNTFSLVFDDLEK